MAVVVNERDALMRGAAARVVDVTLPANVVLPALKGISLQAPSYVVRVDKDGVNPSPSAITVTADLRGVPADTVVAWTQSGGTATLAAQGSKAVTVSALTTDSVKVTGTITVAGETYTDSVTFVKVRDGSVGSDGKRGTASVARAITGSAWSDTEAAQALTNAGYGAPLATDVCTLYNISAKFSEMRRYTGAAWVAVDASTPGTTILPGTVTVEKLLVAGSGIALNADPNTVDATGWDGSSFSVVSDTSAPNGTSALRCTGQGATVLSKKFAIDPSKAYRVRTWAKQESGTSTCYLVVAFYDAAGNVLSGTANPANWTSKGTYHYYGLANQTMPASWSEYAASFGSGEAFGVPAGARFAAVGLISNFTGTGVQRLSGLICHLKTTGDMLVDGTVKAQHIDSKGLVIRDNDGTPIVGAGAALDFSRVGGTTKPQDGATRNVLRGEWAAGQIYQSGDSVIDAGYGWSAKQVHTSAAGNRPPTYPVKSNDFWELSSVKGADAVAYDVQVQSTNGTVFRVGQAKTTTLKARVFKNGVEVTDELLPSQFKWTRVSMVPREAPYDDATWNSQYQQGYKQVSVSVDDVQARATFFCEVNQ